MKRNEHLLILLSEECNEVAHRVSKALRFGLQEKQSGQLLTNAERIRQEVNDLTAVLLLLIEEGILPSEANSLAIEKKKTKIRDYMEYSKALGLVE